MKSSKVGQETPNNTMQIENEHKDRISQSSSFLSLSLNVEKLPEMNEETAISHSHDISKQYELRWNIKGLQYQ